MSEEYPELAIVRPIGKLTIKEQIQAHCQCLPKLSDAKLQRLLDEAINYISVLTCWRRDLCSTFLHEKRVETVPIGDLVLCDCDAGIFSFTPFFQNAYADLIDVDSFLVEIVEIRGIEETVTILSQDKYNFITSLGDLRMQLLDFVNPRECCPPELKARITYFSGYEQIPECLIRVFCDMIGVLEKHNSCDCGSCQECSQSPIEQDAPAFYNDNNNVRQVIDLERAMNIFLNNMVKNGYESNLNLMAICPPLRSPWGAVT